MANDQDTDHLVPYTDEEPSGDVAAGSHDVPEYRDSTDDGGQDVPLLTAPSKKRTRRWYLSILVIGLLASAVAYIVIAGFISFANSRSRHSSSSQQPDGRPNKSHKTQVKQTKAIAFRLNFPALYPDITSKPGSECYAAWDALSNVPCHDKLFDRASDNGTWTFRADPMYFLPRICRDDCRQSLESAYNTISAKCSETDMFNLDGYKGMFNTKWMESGPASALETLVRRVDYRCRSASDRSSDYEFCPVEMLQRFSIIDGMNTNIGAINQFIHETDNRRIEASRWHTGTRGSNKYSYRYHYKVREESYGPGPGETSCGWCTFDFLNHTLNSWAEGAIVDGNQVVSLPEFIRRVRAAGSRCSPTTKWDKIYDEAVQRYISAGLLPADWENLLPSGNVDYLIKNGPSRGDSPVSDIAAELQRLEADNTNEANKQCLSSLESHYLSTKCYINLSNDKLLQLIQEEDELKDVRKAYCDQSCSESLEQWPANACELEAVTPEAAKFVQDYWTARNQRDVFCDLIGKRDSSSWSCSKGLVSMNKTSWAFTGRPDSSVLLADLDKALEEVQKRLTLEKADDANKSSREKEKAVRQRKQDLGNSVCAGCFWDWLTGNNMTETMDYMRSATSPTEYVDFVKKYHTVCTSLGANWLGGVPYGDDPVIWRVKDERDDVVRYFEAPKGLFSKNDVYGVKEAYGSVFYITKERGTRPGLDIGSLWHVLKAQRGFQAAEEGRFDAWNSEETEHRKEADDKIWRVTDFGSVEYIGPKGGF